MRGLFLTDYSESTANPSEQIAAEIVSENWHLQLILDEDYETPEQIQGLFFEAETGLHELFAKRKSV